MNNQNSEREKQRMHRMIEELVERMAPALPHDGNWSIPRLFPRPFIEADGIGAGRLPATFCFVAQGGERIL